MAGKDLQLKLVNDAISRLKEKQTLTPVEFQDLDDFITLREQIKAGGDKGSHIFFKYFVRLLTSIASHEIIDHIKDLLE